MSRPTDDDSKSNSATREPPADTAGLLTTREAALYLRLSASTLERYRVTGDGPEFLKVGRLVFYEKSALDEWLARRRRRSTSDPGPGDEER